MRGLCQGITASPPSRTPLEAGFWFLISRGLRRGAHPLSPAPPFNHPLPGGSHICGQFCRPRRQGLCGPFDSSAPHDLCTPKTTPHTSCMPKEQPLPNGAVQHGAHATAVGGCMSAFAW